MAKIIRITRRKPPAPRLSVRGLPPTLLKDGWWLGEFTILPASFPSHARPRNGQQAADAEKGGATIIPFRNTQIRKRERTRT